MDLALNNLQGLICHKTQPTKPTNLSIYLSILKLRDPQVDLFSTIIIFFYTCFQCLHFNQEDHNTHTHTHLHTHTHTHTHTHIYIYIYLCIYIYSEREGDGERKRERPRFKPSLYVCNNLSICLSICIFFINAVLFRRTIYKMHKSLKEYCRLTSNKR